MVVEETMKLIANISNGYQIMNPGRVVNAIFWNNEKPHAAINSKMFKRLANINDQLYEPELVMPEIEQKEPIIVGFLSNLIVA